MMRIFISGLMIMLGVWSGAKGQERPLVLDSLIQSALQKNPGLNAAQDRQESARYRARAAGTLPDPQFMLGLNSVPRSSWALDESMMSSVSVGISQAIPWPGMIRAESKMAVLEAALMNQETAMARNRLVRLVSQSYYEYSFWTLTLDIIRRNQDVTEAVEEVAEIRYAHGDVSAQDLLRAHSANTRLENTLLEIQNNRLKALLQLARLTDSPTDTSLTVELPDISKEFMAVDTADLARNPEIAQTGLEVDMAGQKLALAHSRYWPELMLNFEYMIRKDTEMDPLRGEDMISVGVGFNLPLWFFAKQKNNARAARLELESSRLRRHDMKLAVQEEISSLLIKLETLAKQNTNFRDKLILQTRAAFESARGAYEVGQIDFGELIMSQMEWLEAEMDQLMNLKEYHQMAAELEELLGRNSEVSP